MTHLIITTVAHLGMKAQECLVIVYFRIVSFRQEGDKNRWSTITCHNNNETTPFSLWVKFLQFLSKHSCLLFMSFGLEQSPGTRLEKLSARFCLLWKCLKKRSQQSSSVLQQSVYYESDPSRFSTSLDISYKSWGAPVITVTGISTTAPFPSSHMDHLGDMFMEAIPASGPEHIQVSHFCSSV